MGKVTLAGARVSKGWSQQELADKMGVSRTTINKWETGKAEMRASYMIAFCSLTGFEPEDICLPESTQNIYIIPHNVNMKTNNDNT